MNLRRKLLLLAGVTLLLPISAWLLLRELEGFLRDGQQQALQATAATVARSLAPLMPVDTAQGEGLVAPPLSGIILDGYTTDWLAGGQEQRNFSNDDGSLSVALKAADQGDHIMLLFDVQDATPVRLDLARLDQGPDRLLLQFYGSRGLLQFDVRSASSGPLTLVASGIGREQIRGFWLDYSDGYRVELQVPESILGQGLSFNLIDVLDPSTREFARRLQSGRMIPLIRRVSSVQRQLSALTAAGHQAWVLDPNGYVLARTPTTESATAEQQASWLERVFYRLVTADNSPTGRVVDEFTSQLDNAEVRSALAGRAAGSWWQHPDSAALVNSIAVPITNNDEIAGAVVLEAVSDKLLLLTNRALIRVLGVALLTMAILVLALYLFASRLSGRVRRLNRAVTDSSTDPALELAPLPMTADRDELGELARSHEDLLRAVRDYNAYLKTLSSKLSHELKTPLVIVRSSLENLARDSMSESSATYLQRAQEGSERLTEILRAMSDASRLEQAIESIEFERFQLDEIVSQSTDAYRQIYPDRHIGLSLKEADYPVWGAPDLIAQLLDKLVSNAVSFTAPEDAIEIRLDRQADEAVLSVVNEGSKLPDSMTGQLFESLVSVRDHKGQEPHLGLGLYLVKLIAEAHQGSSAAANLSGDEGVEFIIRIPLQT